MKQAFQLALLSAANIGLTFFFQWYVLTELGASSETDALFAGMTIPTLALAVISGSLIHVLVPLLAGENQQDLRRNAWTFATLIGGFFGALALLLAATATWWVPLTVPGFDLSTQTLTIALTQIQLIGMVLAAINGVQSAAYHAQQKFLWADFAPVFAGGLTIPALMWALPRYGAIGAAWLTVARLAIQTLLLAPTLGRPCKPHINSPAMTQAWKRIKPLLLGTAYYKTDPLIDKLLLSSTSSGSLSLYHLAQQICGAGSQILSRAITNPSIPALSTLHKSGKPTQFRHIYLKKLTELIFVSGLAMVVMLTVGEDALRIILGHGNLTEEKLRELWWMMLWLGGVLVGGALGQLSSSSFYALGNTTTPTKIGIYSYTGYIPAKILIFLTFGIPGLALSSSAFAVANFMLQHAQLKRTYLSRAEG